MEISADTYIQISKFQMQIFALNGFIRIQHWILDAADKLFCVIVIIFGLNNILLDAFVIPLSAVNIILD